MYKKQSEDIFKYKIKYMSFTVKIREATIGPTSLLVFKFLLNENSISTIFAERVIAI